MVLKLKGKLLPIVALFYVLMASAILISVHYTIRQSVDRQMTNNFGARLDAILEQFEVERQQLLETGMVDAYSGQFKENALEQFQAKYSQDSSLAQPFIVDEKGVILAAATVLLAAA